MLPQEEKPGYVESEFGTVVPPAFSDQEGGGRADLSSETRLSFIVQGAQPVGVTGREVLSVGGSGKLPLPGSGSGMLRKPVSATAVQPVVVPAVAPLSSNAPTVALTAAPVPTTPSVDATAFVARADAYANALPLVVKMVGPFGSFKFRPADAVERDKFVVLVFSKHCGDSELAYEPPHGMPFELRFAMEAGQPDTVLNVVHLGLQFSLEAVGLDIVMFVNANGMQSATD